MNTTRWALLWRSREREHLVRGGDCDVQLFQTRQQARVYRDDNYGYIRDRPDLMSAPHWWRIPLPVRVRVTYEMVAH